MKTTEPLEYAFYQENFEIFQFKFKTYGCGKWAKSYDEAHELAKQATLKKCMEENPHLAFGKPNEVIQVKDLEQKRREFSVLDERYNHSPIHQATPIHVPYGVLSLNPEKAIPKLTIEEQIPEPQSDESIINDIENCDDVKIVESYRFVAKKKPLIKEAVEKRLEELKSKSQTTVNNQ